MAEIAGQLAFGYCSTEGDTAEKKVIFDRIYDLIPQDGKAPLEETLIDNFPFGNLTEGTMIAVYFEHGNSVSSPKLSLSFQTEEQLNTAYYTTLTTKASIWCTDTIQATENPVYSWDNGSLVIFTYVNSKWIISGWRQPGTISILRRWDRVMGPEVGVATLPTSPLIR